VAARKGTCSRETKETAVDMSIDLDGRGTYEVGTGIGFLDHMLELFAKHGLFDLTVRAKGDTHVDDHHTVEDVGICLGRAVAEALGDKTGIRRFGEAAAPLDEALSRVVIDLNGRPFLSVEGRLGGARTGNFDVSLVEDFLRAFATNAQATIHVKIEAGTSAHHVAETVFKALALALDRASSRDERRPDVPSTKGTI
jgi:imidazoleglycerol-phosphate dehydratase